MRSLNLSLPLVVVMPAGPTDAPAPFTYVIGSKDHFLMRIVLQEGSVSCTVAEDRLFLGIPSFVDDVFRTGL
jgi:hypothetical protein